MDILSWTLGYRKGSASATPKLQEKSVTPSTSDIEVTPDSGYAGLSKVTVENVPLQEKTVTAGANKIEVAPDNGYLGLSKVTVEDVALQEKTVTPGESVIEVTADEGYDGLSRVIVEAVANSGGSGNIVFASGSVTGAGKKATITHNLGVVPDIFLIYRAATISSLAKQLINSVGFSGAFKSKFGITHGKVAAYVNTSSPYAIAAYSGSDIVYEYGFINSATETTVVVGDGTSYPLPSGVVYNWIAIGGLT